MRRGYFPGRRQQWMVCSLTLCIPRLITIINLYLFLIKVKVILIIQPAADPQPLVLSSPAVLEPSEMRDERLPSSARLSHLETPQVGAEGEFVGPEGGDPASLVTELSLRTFLSGRTGGEDGEERGAREEQEEQSSGRHDELWTTENICRSGAATEQGPVSQDQDHHDHR